jgi:hypothetical protein
MMTITMLRAIKKMMYFRVLWKICERERCEEDDERLRKFGSWSKFCWVFSSGFL